MDSIIKVLMIDDEEKFRLTTKKLLDRRRFNTIIAESAQKAIEKLSEKPDVVLLDIKMPGMDGHEALIQIKKHSPELPVIMLTARASLKDKVTGKEFIHSFTVGKEVLIRIGIAIKSLSGSVSIGVGDGHFIFGSVAAVGKLLDLSLDELERGMFELCRTRR